jgi:hypothetical protein
MTTVEVQARSRIEGLERTTKRLTIALLCTIVVFAGVSLGDNGARSAVAADDKDGENVVPEIVAAKSFLLMDKKGRARGVWGTNKDGETTLALGDSRGRSIMKLKVTADGQPSISLGDRDGGVRLVLTVIEEGPIVSLASAKGKPVSFWGTNKNGTFLHLLDDYGHPRASMSVQPGDGSTTLELRGPGNASKAGALVLSLGVAPNSDAGIFFSDRKGLPRGGWLVSDTGSTLFLRDQGGVELGQWSADRGNSQFSLGKTDASSFTVGETDSGVVLVIKDNAKRIRFAAP